MKNKLIAMMGSPHEDGSTGAMMGAALEDTKRFLRPPFLFRTPGAE